MEIPFKSASGESMTVQSGDPRADVRFIRVASDQRAGETMFVLTNEEARRLVQYLGDWFTER